MIEINAKHLLESITKSIEEVTLLEAKEDNIIKLYNSVTDTSHVKRREKCEQFIRDKGDQWFLDNFLTVEVTTYEVKGWFFSKRVDVKRKRFNLYSDDTELPAGLSVSGSVSGCGLSDYCNVTHLVSIPYQVVDGGLGGTKWLYLYMTKLSHRTYNRETYRLQELQQWKSTVSKAISVGADRFTLTDKDMKLLCSQDEGEE